MSDNVGEKTPEKSPAKPKKLDQMALVYELAIRLENGDKPNWEEIAKAAGSASGGSAQKCWQNLKKKRAQMKESPEGEDGADAVLKPKPAKVEKKPRTPKKKAVKSDAVMPEGAEADKAKPAEKPPPKKRGRKPGVKNGTNENAPKAEAKDKGKEEANKEVVKEESVGKEAEHAAKEEVDDDGEDDTDLPDFKPEE